MDVSRSWKLVSILTGKICVDDFFNDVTISKLFHSILDYKIKKVTWIYRATLRSHSQTTALHTNIRSVFTRCKYYLKRYIVFLKNFFEISNIVSLQFWKIILLPDASLINVWSVRRSLSRRYEAMPILCFFLFYH